MKSEIIIALIVALVIVSAIAASWIGKLRHEFLIHEGFTGLLYHKGRLAETLQPGRHIRWGRHFQLVSMDVRKTSLTIAGQEVLTADNVGLKASLLVTYQFADLVKALHDTQSWYADLYNAAQLALRSVVGGVTAEALLGQRLDIGAQLLARVQPEAAKAGLANAARVLEGNPALMNLRVLQSLATAQNAGNTLVLGMPAGFVPLKNGKATASRNEPGAAET